MIQAIEKTEGKEEKRKSGKCGFLMIFLLSSFLGHVALSRKEGFVQNHMLLASGNDLLGLLLVLFFAGVILKIIGGGNGDSGNNNSQVALLTMLVIAALLVALGG